MKVRNTFSTVIIYVFLIALCLIWLLPVASTLLVTFKTPTEYMNTKFYEMSKSFYIINNLEEVFSYYRLQINFVNSLVYAVSGIVFCVR
jgi:multiple sugar transport system permease protein